MDVFLTKNFSKQYQKLPQRLQEKVEERLGLFSLNPFDTTLRNHALKGSRKGSWSINITGDYRALYTVQDDTAIFIAIGTHAELYRT